MPKERTERQEAGDSGSHSSPNREPHSTCAARYTPVAHIPPHTVCSPHSAFFAAPFARESQRTVGAEGKIRGGREASLLLLLHSFYHLIRKMVCRSAAFLLHAAILAANVGAGFGSEARGRGGH